MNDSSFQRNREACDKALSCWFITGATASGKTAIGLELASRLHGEIISLDSMAIYRGMDIGTAKPTAEQRSAIPHHMIDIADPVAAFSVTQYRDQALAAIDDIRQRGHQPIFVGGTALYLKGLLRGIFEGPPADWEFRHAIEAEVAEVGLEPLYNRLQQVDPVSAQKLHPNDQRRIIRALEVYKATGQPISHLQNEFEFCTDALDCRVFSIRHPRPELHQRIEHRVGEMFASGLIDEVRGLLNTWGDLGHTASQAVGYKEVLDFVNNANATDADLEATFQKVLTRTRRFARHQETWFRGMAECRILDIDSDTAIESVVEQVIQLGSERS